MQPTRRLSNPKRLLGYLCLLFCCLSILCAPTASLYAAPPQQAEVVLQIRNQAEQTICYVFIVRIDTDNEDNSQFFVTNTATDETYSVALLPGNYNLLLTDCNGNALLLDRDLAIRQDRKLLLKQVDVKRTACDMHNQEGMRAYPQGLYHETMTALQSALNCYRELNDQMGESQTLNNIGFVYYKQGRNDEALALYDEALAILKDLGDRPGEGTTLNNIGAVYQIQGRNSEALSTFEEALMIWQEVGDRYSEGITLSNIGAVYQAQGRNGKALVSHEEALAILKEVGDRPGEGTTPNNIGLLYQAQGYYGRALALYEEALAILKEVGDQPGEGSTLNNIGFVYDNQGRHDEAIALYEQALIIRQEVGDRVGEATTLNNIAMIYHDLGRYGEALALYEQALTIRQEVDDYDGEGATINNIAGVFQAQGRYDEALAHLEQVLAIVQRVGNRVEEGATLNNIAEVYHEQGRYDEALALYEQALTIVREVGDRAREGTTLHNIAGVYRAKGQHDETLANYDEALAISREVGDRSGEAATLNNMGLVYANQGGYDEALAIYDKALAILREVGDQASEGTTLNNVAAVHEAQGRYGEALTIYMAGLNVLENVRVAAGSDQARTSFIEGYVFVYDRVIALSYQEKDVAQAFWYSEQGRARVLLDVITTGQVHLRDYEAAALLAAEQEAYAVRQTAQDTLAKARAANPPDPTWVREAEAALRAAEATYEQAAAAIAARSDQLTSLIPGRQQVPQLAEVQALLDTDTTLLSYWTLEDKTLAFIITAKDAAIVELPGVTAQTVLTMTESLYQWRNPDNPYPLPLRQLYQALIAPLADKLKTPHLAIIPHQSLHYVPFAALVDEAHNKQYLGEQYTLSVLPSASILRFLKQNAASAQTNRAGSAIVFGDPASNEPALPRLFNAASEANAVAALLNTVALTDTAASEPTLWQAAQGARIVHLAAHGAYNQANALYSAIYLAPTAAITPTHSLSTTGELPSVNTTLDGHLETHEIFGLPLEGNDIVVLSACQTNIGNLSRGDDIVGLTRAFFFAGAPTVIASLWNVDDAATETLMVAFYRHWLEEGMSKAAALQAAQADVRSDSRWVSPFYWAGFVLNGDPE